MSDPRKIQARAAVRMALVLGVAVAAVGAAPAGGEPGSDARAELDITLDARAPGTPTGVRFHVAYKHPTQAGAKPPPLTAALFELPEGTRIDSAATPVCRATDGEFRALGLGACSSASRVGGGRLTAVTGLGAPLDPVHGDVTVFNGGHELVEVVTYRGTNTVLGLDRLGIEGHALRAHPPATPGGPPDGRTSITLIEIALPERGRLFVSPDECPRGGRWTSRGSFAFTDGGQSTVTSTTPCSRAAAGPSAVTTLRVRPRRVLRGRAVRFRARASSTAPRCASRATLRFGGRRVRTNRSGRAAPRVRFRRAGLRVVRLRKPGCPPARARVRVVRR